MATQGQGQGLDEWLSNVEASVEEATEHQGPLDERKLLMDLRKLTSEMRGQLWHRQSAEQHVEGLVGANLRSAEKIEHLTAANTRLKEANELSQANAKARTQAQANNSTEWLLWESTTQKWWKAPGDGYTKDRAGAHRYTWRDAARTVGARGGDRAFHISDPEPEPDTKD